MSGRESNALLLADRDCVGRETLAVSAVILVLCPEGFGSFAGGAFILAFHQLLSNHGAVCGLQAAPSAQFGTSHDPNVVGMSEGDRNQKHECRHDEAHRFLEHGRSFQIAFEVGDSVASSVKIMASEQSGKCGGL